jgi:hypothetical protein
MLVLFAGVGRDMVELDGMAEGRADITGVELNPAVVDLVRDPLLAGMNLRAFHARPNIHLLVCEGRDFLNHDRGRYDLLFVVTNGSRAWLTRTALQEVEAACSGSFEGRGSVEASAPGGLSGAGSCEGEYPRPPSGRRRPLAASKATAGLRGRR